MIGMLPRIRDRDSTLANMSALNRSYAFMRNIARRRGRALRVEIAGRDRLISEYCDVMLHIRPEGARGSRSCLLQRFGRDF